MQRASGGVKPGGLQVQTRAVARARASGERQHTHAHTQPLACLAAGQPSYFGISLSQSIVEG